MRGYWRKRDIIVVRNERILEEIMPQRPLEMRGYWRCSPRVWLEMRGYWRIDKFDRVRNERILEVWLFSRKLEMRGYWRYPDWWEVRNERILEGKGYHRR